MKFMTGKRIKMPLIIIVTMFSLIVLPTISVAIADTSEGFDDYVSGYAGNVLPMPWTFATNNPTCWSVPTNAPPTGVTPLGNKYQPTASATTSPPNVFEFNFNANCYGFTTTASITTSINMTSSTLFLDWWQSMIAVTPPASMPMTNNSLPAGTITESLLVDGVAQYSNDTSSIKVCGCWNQISNSAGLPESPGSVHTVTWQISVVPYSDAYTFSLAIDTLGFTNSNPIITGNNFVVMDYLTHQWFNFNTTGGSQLALNYTAPDIPPPCQSGSSGFTLGPGVPTPSVAGVGNNCVVSNISTPDLIVPDLSLISLATVTYSTQYSRSVIPCLDPLNGITTVNPLTCTKQRVYMDESTTANPITKYSITVTDLTNTVSNGAATFGSAGVKIFLYRGTTLITSGYTDAQSSFGAALTAGTYHAILMNQAGNEFSTSINAEPTSLTISIQISVAGYSAANNQNNPSIYAALTCNGTSTVATYFDNTATTTAVSFHLELLNISGVYPISSQTLFTSLSGTYASATFGINGTLAAEYEVTANSTQTTGAFPVLGPVVISSGQTVPGCNINLSFPKTPVFPNSVLGLNDVLPTPAAWLNLLSLFILFITAALFGARAASLGTVFVVIEAIVFAYAGWIPLQSFYVSLFMVVSMVVFLAQKARKRY